MAQQQAPLPREEKGAFVIHKRRKIKMKVSNKTNRLLALLLALVLTLGATACGEKQPAASSAPAEGTSVPAASQPEAPAVDPDAEIVLAGYRNLAPGEKDGYYCSKILYVWEPLVTQDDTAAPQPCLAESWEMSGDGKQWTFYLRQGVKFHDGADFNADAVIANFDRMGIEVKSSSFYPLDINSHYPNLEKYEKVDDYTIRLTFSQPAPTQLYNMVNFGSAMYSPDCFDENGDFNGICAGTGPFRITENVLGEYVLLERFDGYWGEKAKAKTIRVKVIPDADTRFSALKSGEILGVIDLNAIPTSLAVQLKEDDGFALTTTKSTMIRFLTLNGTQFPFDDVRLRQAVSLVLQRAVITESVYDGFGTPTTNILNYATPFYKDFPVEEDLAKAKELAGEVLGDQRITVTYLYNGSEAALKGEAELISSWLSQIGIDCDLQPMEYSNMKELMKAGDYGIARMQQGLSNSEPATIFRRFMLTSGDHNQNYSLGYHSDEVDELMEQAAAALDMDVRTACYDRIQEISTQEFPVIPLFNDMTLMAYSTKLTGYDAKLYGIELPLVAWAQ